MPYDLIGSWVLNVILIVQLVFQIVLAFKTWRYVNRINEIDDRLTKLEHFREVSDGTIPGGQDVID